MIITLIIALLSLVVLMVIHEFGHFIIAKKFGVKVEEFGIGYPPRIVGKQFGETLYSINWIPFGAFVKIYGEEGGLDDYRSFSNLVIWKRVLIVLGGVIAFWLAAIVIFSVAFLIGAQAPIGDQDVQGITATHVEVLSVRNNSPAQKAGLTTGDEIKDFNKIADFQKFIEANKGNEITINILRHGKEMNVALTPRVDVPQGEGPTGIALERFADIIPKVAWYQAPVQGTIYTGKVTVEALKGIYGFFASLFKGHGVPQGAQLAGPVGITIFLSQAASLGAGFFLYFIGSLSVLLAIFNVFPIPALDGGKIVFLLFEKIFRKPVPVIWEQRITIICFVVLILLSFSITVFFDIPRVIDFWKAGL